MVTLRVIRCRTLVVVDGLPPLLEIIDGQAQSSDSDDADSDSDPEDERRQGERPGHTRAVE